MLNIVLFCIGRGQVLNPKVKRALCSGLTEQASDDGRNVVKSKLSEWASVRSVFFAGYIGRVSRDKFVSLSGVYHAWLIHVLFSLCSTGAIPYTLSAPRRTAPPKLSRNVTAFFTNTHSTVRCNAKTTHFKNRPSILQKRGYA